MKIENNPLVSVVIPCYNADRYIEESLRSIMKQSYTNLEIIVINDGSIDDTKSLLLNLAKEDARIVYVENTENLKLIKTLNKAISLSNGIYIARMDADDISHPERIQKQVEFYELNKDIAILGTAILEFGILKKKILNKQPVNDIDIKSKMFVANAFHHPTIMFNTNMIDKSDLNYNTDYYRVEDYELWIRLMLKGYKFANLSVPLLDYRVLEYSETSLISTNDKNETLIKLFEKAFKAMQVDLSKSEIYNYVLTLNRQNFDKVNIRDTDLIYDKIRFKLPHFKLKGYYAKRWVAILFFGNKKDLIENLFFILKSSYTRIAFFHFKTIKNK